MFSDLPKDLQKKVEKYLQADNFRAAKAIHDAWFDQFNPNSMSNRHQHLVIAEPVSS